MINLVYSGRPVPNPARVRLYKLDIKGFVDVVSRFKDQLGASQRVLNAAFVPARVHLDLYIQAYLRAYLLSCYYDTYLSLGLVPSGFTPSKVVCVLAQPMPKLLLDAMRELIRPVVVPIGMLLIPEPNTFLNDKPYLAESIVRNSVPLGYPDRYLLKFGIQWFPCLGIAFRAAWMTGTSDSVYALSFVEDMKREGLEPAKAAFLLELCEFTDEHKKVKPKEDEGDKAKEKAVMPVDEYLSRGVKIKDDLKDEKKERLRLSVSECDMSDRKLDNAKWKELYLKNGDPDKGYNDSIFQFEKSRNTVIRRYWMHDFDTENDKVRDFAMRILRPIRVQIFDDVFMGRIQRANDLAPADLAFLGVDVWRGSVPYTIWDFQQMKDMFEGHPIIENRAYYLFRWISTLGMELKKWHFPSIGEAVVTAPADVAPVVQISRGRGIRRRRFPGRGRGRGGPPGEGNRG